MSAPEYQNVELPRDRWGRPLVLPPNARKNAKRIAYRRTTTFVGCLDDMNGLMAWKCRQVAYGMGQRKDLVVAAAAADPADKKLLAEIADKATEAASSSAGATVGTALHSFTERIDRGQPLGHVPAEYQADLDAYQRATEHIEWLGIETFRVDDNWKVAGTADRIGRMHGRTMIMDIKGLSLDTRIPTPTGWTTMGAVRVGDQVLGSDGRPCNVILKSDAKRIGTYLVRFDDGSTVVCDSEHIWWTTTEADRQAGRGPSARPIGEVIATLTVGRKRPIHQHHVPLTAPIDLPHRDDLPVDPYLLGAWLGDGKAADGRIGKSDELFDILESDGHELGTRYEQSGCVVRSVRGLYRQLRTAGLLRNKHVPDSYLRASLSQRLRLVQGLLDTDGGWTRDCVTFTSTDKGLAYAVEELLLSLGQRPKISEQTAHGFGKSVTCYRVAFSPIDMQPFRLRSKAARVVTPQWIKSSTRRIVSVEPGPDVETACIGVDSADHVYLCSERMIPTHNTGSMADYVVPKMAMQLAMYARMIPYDIPTDTRGTDPEPVDPNRGIIIHLPAGQGRCDLYEIDLSKGWGACLIAKQVWDWRATKDLVREAREPKPPPTWESLIADARDLDDLRLIWSRAKELGALTPELKAAATARSRELAA